ncbi:alpha/beta hydrolase [Actibacterium lipolyticum]|uniref:Alpha/beta hydrolase family protein n=1 Tax=Actibacterium lipolyticum TaxID=1524263 RepID=A0A238KWG5_9RHOB|nr:alpha/beta fold hydrolase [Actibacterium lipolyticum]SMX47135.1 Alpha/beta hydrolase family protein [Actibacterium lipolyticum]
MSSFKFLVFALVALAACTPRPSLILVPEAANVGEVVDVYYASTRTPDVTVGLGIERSSSSSFGRISVAIPPEHQVGKVEVAEGRPDPAESFAIADVTNFPNADTFRKTLAQTFRSKPKGAREAVIFVHGFNNNFAEGVFRTAQLEHDFELDGVAIHYAWPSRGSAVGYAYDRDSALFARDGLEQLLRDVRAAGAESVLLIAHSMGAQLSMESMRQMAIRSPAELRRSVDAVVLLSPDIDIDVFRSQATRIGQLPQPFVIFVSQRDRALALSARLSGESNRLGNVESIDQVADIDVTIFDVTEFTKATDLGHFTVGNSPALINLLASLPGIDALFRGDTSGRLGLLQGTVLTVQEATKVVLSPISVLAE